MGIIKKRDRLEFAVEKAVELGVFEIALFRSERTVKENVRMDRLESIAVSAMKQSLRAWLPEITFYRSFDALLNSYSDCTVFAAHEKIDSADKTITTGDSDKNLLLVGPEGGFSANEIEKLKSRNVKLLSLGRNRLRTETAALVFLSKFLP
jgi:16S rRNA (uracil1498-N3)-methyltransferase